MDTVQGVDVGWLQHSQKGGRLKGTETSLPTSKAKAPSSSGTDIAPPLSHTGAKHTNEKPTTKSQETTNGTTESTPSSTVPTKTVSKRPSILGRSSSEKLKANLDPATSDPVSAAASKTSTPKSSTPPSRRNSWISNLSSKFSSSNNVNNAAQAAGSPAREPTSSNGKQIPPAPRIDTNPFGAAYSPQEHHEANQESPSPLSQSPKANHPGFLSSALRRLSSGGSGLGRQAAHGAVCQRRIMNVDHHRERCRIPDFDQAKLKRVSFCVDVEIAAPVKYLDDDKAEYGSPPKTTMEVPEVSEKAKKKMELQKKGEGAALKKAQAVLEDQEPEAIVNTEVEKTTSTKEPPTNVEQTEQPAADKTKEAKEPTKKQEKKKRSEEERKERKERRRRQAEANGQIPIEFTRDDSDMSSSTGNSTPKRQIKPTTDPTRIYRRCCQLRETPVLKVVVEQINAAPPSAVAEAPGTVPILDLSNHTLKLSDVITLGDWLAVVPVRKLMLEHCGLTDEAVRIILAGLLASKTMEQARFNKRLPRTPGSVEKEEERIGVIEKLSLKGNPSIGREGWRHIGLFIHMSKSIKGINLSHNPIPQPAASANSSTPHHTHVPLTRTNTNLKNAATSVPISALISKALAERLAGKCLEEVIMDDCHLTAHDIGNIVDGVMAAGSIRLGLASNNIDADGLAHIVRYISTGNCEGIDLAGNDMHELVHLLADAVGPETPLQMVSLGYCGLTPSTVEPILAAFTVLPNLRYLDLSHNHGLFEAKVNALGLLRRYLPKLAHLRRIHLSDIELTPDHAISLSEVLPDCPQLCHVTILDNPKIKALAAAKDANSQEEACALYASLMTAVRVSRTIISIDVDAPTTDSHEVVKALASQIVAYGLRNLSQGPFAEAYPDAVEATKGQIEPIPEILLHIVGHMDGYDINLDPDDAAPDDDYVIGGKGVVKALGICLGSAEGRRGSSTPSRNASPARPGASPRRLSTVPTTSKNKEKPRDMAIQLLDSARKIRARLRPVLIREDKAGNDVQWRRLHYLDTTVQRMILRFEEEYPEFKQPADAIDPTQPSISAIPTSTSKEDPTTLSTSPPDPDYADEYDPTADLDPDPENPSSLSIRRTPSSTSLASRALTSEEGRMHRFGQRVRRDLLRPQTTDYAHGTLDTDPPEAPHLSALRAKLELLRGDEIKARVDMVGADQVVKEINANADELRILAREDPGAFERFRGCVALKSDKVDSKSGEIATDVDADADADEVAVSDEGDVTI